MACAPSPLLAPGLTFAAQPRQELRPGDVMRRMRPLLGTYVEIGVAAPGAEGAVEAAFGRMARAQRQWSFQCPVSELSRLNAHPGQRIAVSGDTLRLLRLACTLMRRSRGHFDCTVGGALVRAGALPDHGGPAPLLRGRPDDIELGAAWARLRRPVRLTLDGIAKGFAVDLAVGQLRRLGVRAGWVNAGGDIRVFGALALPVQRREDGQRVAALGELVNAALATSRAGPADPRFPARLVAPAGGRVSRGIWSVLARSAWRADALTKVAATVPHARRKECVAVLGGCLVQAP